MRVHIRSAPATFSESAELSCACPIFRCEKFAEPTRYERNLQLSNTKRMPMLLEIRVFHPALLWFSIANNENNSVMFIAEQFIATTMALKAKEKALTRSLPRDVYIRRKNDHTGGQGRIYTSNLNFISTHLSKPGHRRGCCCMSPRCLLHQFVGHCLLSWAFFIEKTALLCCAQYLSKWRETALWMFPDATQAGTSCTFDGFRDDGDRGESWFRLVESEGNA